MYSLLFGRRSACLFLQLWFTLLQRKKIGVVAFICLLILVVLGIAGFAGLLGVGFKLG